MSTSVARKSRRQQEREADRDKVSGYALGAHLGMSRQGVDKLVAQGILTREPDGMFAQAKCRLAYIRHLKTERHSSASALAQAQYHRSKAKLLEMKIARQEQETMSVADHNALIDAAIGVGPYRVERPAGNDRGYGPDTATQM